MSKGKGIWLDGIMGVAVGDALGLPVQFQSRSKLAQHPVTGMLPCDLFESPIGTWSDDTAMSLAMFESIKRLGRVDADDIMKNFVKWLYEDEFTANGECIDEGNTCYVAIKNYKEHGDIHTCGRTGEYANGNGSLMRTLPVCLYYALKVHSGGGNALLVEASDGLVDQAISDIHLVSALTHNHLRACMACGLYFFSVYAVLYEEGTLIERLQKGMDAGFKYYRACAGGDGFGSADENENELSHYGWFKDLADFATLPESSIESTGYVVDSFEAAIWSLITTDSYRDAMIKAVNLGDDTDTIAAIAGGLAGLYYGIEGIPEEWLAVLRRREWIEDMIGDN